MAPPFETIISYLTIFAALMGALFAALWLSLIIWSFRDMRSRVRDPFAPLLAALLVALLPGMGIIIYLILRPPETLVGSYERALEEEALLQEIEERPACPGCSRTIEASWILCPHCHTRLRKACPDCNGLMDLQWNLCPFCGNQHIDPYGIEAPDPMSQQSGHSVPHQEHKSENDESNDESPAEDSELEDEPFE